MEKIGYGGISEVFKHDGVAIKIINNDANHDYDKELEIIKLCNSCPNIVQYLDHNVDEKSITMELMEFTLRDLLADPKQSCEFWIEKMLKDILFAIDFLDQHNIYHGDINSMNVMVNLGDEKVFKLIDFSHSSYTNDFEISSCHEIFGAPELYNNKFDWYFDKMMIWSLGQLYYFCLKKKYLMGKLFKKSRFKVADVEFATPQYFEDMRLFIQSGDLNQDDIKDMIWNVIPFYPYNDKFKAFLLNCCLLDPNGRKTAKTHLAELF